MKSKLYIFTLIISFLSIAFVSANEFDAKIDKNINLVQYDQSITILENGVLSNTNITRNHISVLNVDIYNGKTVLINNYNNEVKQSEFWLNPINSSLIKMSEELDTWFVIGSKDSLQKSSCGIFAAAVDSAQRTLSTAEQIGNQYLIQSAKDALGVAVSSFMGCVATHPF